MESGNSTGTELATSTKITIGVLSGVAGFGMIVIITVLLCLLVQSKRKLNGSNGGGNAGNLGVGPMPPYYIGSHQSTADLMDPPPPQYQNTDNPAYLNSDYDGWGQTMDDSGFYPDVISDLHRKSDDGKDVRWSTVSLRAHENYDYERYGRIPRAKLLNRKDDLLGERPFS